MLLVNSIAADTPDLRQCDCGLAYFMAAAPSCSRLDLALALERVHADSEVSRVKLTCFGQIKVLELQFSGDSEAVSSQLANPASLRGLHTLILAGIARYNLTVLANLDALENLALHFCACLDISPLKELHNLRYYLESSLSDATGAAHAAAAMIVLEVPLTSPSSPPSPCTAIWPSLPVPCSTQAHALRRLARNHARQGVSSP